ncbi:MAG: hypothetical protein ABJD75_03590 [Parasphingorhabdus sp.]|uniref:hypothetical protein n=2 Tax=Parasphingorhabdus sp. TaxID=2709688 RepID=UPI003263C574
MIIIQLFYVLFLAICASALVWGGKPEKAAVLILVPGFLLSMLAVSPLSQRFANVELGLFLVDSAMLTAFVILALNAERYWPLWMSAMQAIQVISHLPIIFIPELLPQAYGAVIGIWSYPMLALLGIGTWRHRQRLKKFGADKSWSNF